MLSSDWHICHSFKKRFLSIVKALLLPETDCFWSNKDIAVNISTLKTPKHCSGLVNFLKGRNLVLKDLKLELFLLLLLFSNTSAWERALCGVSTFFHLHSPVQANQSWVRTVFFLLSFQMPIREHFFVFSPWGLPLSTTPEDGFLSKLL